MVEVEIKISIPSKKKAIAKLKSLGCKIGKPTLQNDYIFIDKQLLFSDIKPGMNILRIRVENNKRSFLTLKQQINNELNCLEFELGITDPIQMRCILVQMNYYEVIEVRKTRIKTFYENYQIVIDEVDQLGCFIEVEKMLSSDNDSLIVQDQLFDFFKSLQIPYTERVSEGYDTLLSKK